jgi:MerR family transcriptional regulator, light-induced transcriptional regulator
MASIIGFSPRMFKPTRRRQPGRGAPTVNRLIESEVIPRLLLAHSNNITAIPIGSGEVSAAEIEHFAPLAVTLEAHELLAEVEQYLQRGLSVDRMLVELLAPAARHLGEQWKRDELDFVEVTMGLWRLQEVLREIAARAPPSVRANPRSRSVLFSPFPGDQHSFGTAIVEECFARAGWDTELLVEPTRGELIARVANHRFDLVGLTVSRDCHIAALPTLLTALRNVSRNPDLLLLLGGPVLIENPKLAPAVGADGTAATALGALDEADRLMTPPVYAATA